MCPITRNSKYQTELRLIAPLQLDLDALFRDPDDDPLTFTVESLRPEVVKVFIDQSLLQIWPRQAGESLVMIAADDGHHPPVSVAIRVLVHPVAHPPAEADFSFHHWTLALRPNLPQPMNGLDELGVSFINTSNAQDLPGAGFLGSAVVALRTTGVDEVWVSWTGGQLTTHQRPLPST